VAEAAPTLIDPRLENARPSVRRFLWLAIQLALLAGVFHAFRLEQSGPKDSGFLLISYLTFGAFLVHYWLPFRFKERFWVAVSLLSVILSFDARVATGLLAVGVVFYLVLSSRLRYWWRVGLVVAAGGGAALVRSHLPLTNRLLGEFHIPVQFWPAFGSIFMFRMIIYIHDLRHLKIRPSLREYLAYFFMAPNCYFQLFPVIDYSTMRLSYYRRNIHDAAQQGIDWIYRGTLQLILYRFIYYLRDLQTRDDVHSLPSLFWYMLLTYLLYLRVSGQFHIIVGILHLFGYDLPETNRKYLLAHSVTDFWRRINIYWKDFMVKIVYFPVYFRLRKKSDLGARLLATGAVFGATWALHVYQSFWLNAGRLVSWTDTIFWSCLCVLVAGNVWLETRTAGHRPVKPTGLGTAISVAGTFALIVTLWSIWNSPSLDAWLDLMKRGFGLS
jgi:D-alanyl-lipoteichoic acid acyltransferase DltB (MBOAT superfamily)